MSTENTGMDIDTLRSNAKTAVSKVLRPDVANNDDAFGAVKEVILTNMQKKTQRTYSYRASSDSNLCERSV
jgi:hypothetical protein